MKLDELYQEVIIDHSQNPRNCRELGEASHQREGFNTLCGDRVHLFVEVKEGKILRATFQGNGCAISQASASILTEVLPGKTVEQAKQTIAEIQLALQGKNSNQLSGDLDILARVCQFPMRVKCALLPWVTFREILDDRPQS